MTEGPPHNVPIPDPTICHDGGAGRRRRETWTREISDEKLRALRDLVDDRFNTAAALRDVATTISAIKQSGDTGSGGRQQRAESTAAWIFLAAAVAIAALAILIIIRTAC